MAEAEVAKYEPRDKSNDALDDLLRQMVGRFQSLVVQKLMPPDVLKVANSRPEAIQILRQNRKVVSEQLSRRLFNNARPSPDSLENRGIVPPGYFTKDFEKAMQKRHRRRSTTTQDIAIMIQMRPKAEEVVQKGFVPAAEAMQFMGGEPMLDSEDEMENDQMDGPWEISLLHSLLFLTIQEALKRSCIDCQRSEEDILSDMEGITLHLKSLRDALDKYDASNILEFEKDEEQVREQFRQLQMKLLSIGSRQQKIHQKLVILHGVERELIELQNQYDQQLSKLRRAEEIVLDKLKRTRTERDRAMRIMHAEKSHQNWAMAKLDYTISVAEEHNAYMQKTLTTLGATEKKDMEDEYEKEESFMGELQTFLQHLKDLSEHQNQIVREFESTIEELESDLLSIRHEMAQVRSKTFKKIYDLHRNVEIADTLDLGYRRLSVANATEIERERQHHSVKIQRQLSTLQSQLRTIDISEYGTRLSEIVDIQMIMSDRKLKTFFSVFVQTFTQSCIDIDLVFQQFHAQSQPPPNMSEFLSDLYGMKEVLNQIQTKQSLPLEAKVGTVMTFLRVLKNAVRCELNKALTLAQSLDMDEQKTIENGEAQLVMKVRSNQLDTVAIMVGRKLCTDRDMQQEIDRTTDSQISQLAEMRSRDIFEAVCNQQKLFNKIPQTATQAALQVLLGVFGIAISEETAES